MKNLLGLLSMGLVLVIDVVRGSARNSVAGAVGHDGRDVYYVPDVLHQQEVARREHRRRLA